VGERGDGEAWRHGWKEGERVEEGERDREGERGGGGEGERREVVMTGEGICCMRFLMVGGRIHDVV
jgi:hypothetical protein